MKPRILVIYTGGTIGMIKDPVSGHLSNVDFNLIYDHVPELKRLNVELDTMSLNEPIDSSEIQPKNWIDLAKLIQSSYDSYNGFVVLHGSDTMSYTASALSFMFDGLRKPIVLTGSQLPIGVIRTDGKENLITAIEIASTSEKDGEPLIQEVAVYFDYQLFRGNRSTKHSAENFEAFKSPNYDVLCTAGVEIKYNYVKLYRSRSEKLSLNTSFNSKVVSLKLFPGMNFELYKTFFNRDKVDGILLETFGAGNAPSSRVFKELLSKFMNEGGVVLNLTQCSSGSVRQGLYKTSSQFNDLGVISGADMTYEAAITKLMLSLDMVSSSLSINELLSSNLRGEMSI
ncbi:MAG: asparaginase [Flavobacteriales bacterium]|nr:asparaginase [Flavobacteriales bacterium]